MSMVPLEDISDPWITLLELRVNKLRSFLASTFIGPLKWFECFGYSGLSG